jgi:hypothetical protein
MATGPVTRDTSTLALGLAQVRVGVSAANIANIQPALAAGDSIGSLADTKFTSEVEFWRHSSGFPLMEDYVIPLSEKATLECAYEEIKPYTLALARGIDASSGYDQAHSGEIALGQLASPAYVRMEALYTFPNGSNYMTIIFPRAQAVGAMEIALSKEDNSKPTITFESKVASSDVSGGHAVWDDKPMGRILFT